MAQSSEEFDESSKAFFDEVKQRCATFLLENVDKASVGDVVNSIVVDLLNVAFGLYGSVGGSVQDFAQCAVVVAEHTNTKRVI